MSPHPQARYLLTSLFMNHVSDILIQSSNSISSPLSFPLSKPQEPFFQNQAPPYPSPPHSQPSPRQHRPSIRGNHTPIQMGRGPTGQKDHQASKILRMTHPPIRRHLRQLVLPALQLHQPARHLTRVEPRRDRIAEDMPRSQLNRQALGEMDRGGFGRRVREGSVVAERADADPRDRGGDDDACRVVPAWRVS